MRLKEDRSDVLDVAHEVNIEALPAHNVGACYSASSIPESYLLCIPLFFTKCLQNFPLLLQSVLKDFISLRSTLDLLEHFILSERCLSKP